MEQIIIEARGKINLSLDILGLLPNGYHEVSMVMQPIALADRVKVRKTRDKNISIACNVPSVPTDGRNIVYQAAKRMQERFDLPCGFSVEIEKRIPVAGGMAGGSTNGAALLGAVNILCELNLSLEKLMEIGLTLGADVPFCLLEQPALAQGIGEILTPIKGLEDCDIVLVNPNKGVCTKEIYQAVDAACQYGTIDNQSLIQCLKKGDWIGGTEYMKNVMQPITEKKCREIPKIIRDLKGLGAVHAMMSGSGPTCFGIFRTGTVPKDICRHFPDYFVECTEPFSKTG